MFKKGEAHWQKKKNKLGRFLEGEAQESGIKPATFSSLVFLPAARAE